MGLEELVSGLVELRTCGKLFIRVGGFRFSVCGSGFKFQSLRFKV